MEVERIFLREFPGQGVAENTRRVGLLVVASVVAGEDHLLGSVGNLDVAEGFAEPARAVIVERVTRQRIAVFGHYQRATIKVRLLRISVVYAVGSINRAVARNNGGCRVEHGNMGAGVVEHLLRVDVEGVLVAQRMKHHILAEQRILRCRGIFTVPRTQAVFRVGEHAADLIVSEVDAEVVVENVGRKLHVAVDEPHLFADAGIQHRQLRGIGIHQLVGVDEQGVALLHAHVSEGLDSPGIVVEMC